MEAEGRLLLLLRGRRARQMTLVSQPAAQLWVPRDYATSASSSSFAAAEQVGAGDKLSRLFKGAADFAVDNNTFTEAQIRATFYPKFENEKSDQETSNPDD